VDTFIQLTLNGLTLGSVYALIALGYSLVYGILKLLNFAHGDVFMVGAFIGFGALQLLGGTFRFSTKTNDPLNKGFTIFEIQSNGSYKVVS
jgi:branched-subunit amino acid ABC-type transport system permease component